MSFTCAARGALVVLVAALAACRSGPRADAAAPSGSFAITERAEAGPITAIAVRPPYLWVAGGAGLRRYELGETEARRGRPASTPGRARCHGHRDRRRRRGLGRRRDGEVGRWVDAGDELRYERKGTPGTVTALAPRRPVATEGIWAAGPGGLFRYDGRIFHSVDALCDVPVTSLALDDDGKGAWVGDARARPVSRRRRPRRAGARRRGLILRRLRRRGEDRRRDARRGRQRRRRGAAVTR